MSTSTRGNFMKKEEAGEAGKAAYVPPKFQKRQLLKEVLGQVTVTTHGAPPQ
jgi:hypothetical protein